jgi:hypothetical protein
VNNIKRKTYEEHKEYLFEIVKLQLWFLWNWKMEHPEESFSNTLRNRIDIYRKTNTNKGSMNPDVLNFEDPKWLNIEAELECVYNKYSNSTSADDFEKYGFEIVKSEIEARSRRDYEEKKYVLGYKCGSLNYDPPETDTPNLVFFHIANAIQPKSIFDDISYLPKCLMEVIEKASKEYPETIGLHTMTWLNSHPEWRKMFPEVWFENMEERPDVEWHFSYWGQFISARGTFNKKLGDQFRKTGKFPFAACYSWSTYDELKEHLKKMLPCS